MARIATAAPGAGRRDLIIWENLKELQKHLKELDTGLDKELREKLKVAGQTVAEQAKEEALSRGLYSTRDAVHLAEKNVPHATMSQVVIRNKATRGGFRYPGIYEYGGAELRATHGKLSRIRNRSEQGARLKQSGTSLVPGLGPRAFLAPAVVKKLPEFEKQLELAIDETARKAGFK